MAKHSNIRDEGAVFVIEPHTRKVTVPTTHFVIGTVGEHLSEQITFECPTTIDGHDITGCNKKYVTWRSVNGAVGHDELDDMTVEGDVARFKWNVRSGLTVAKGVVSFSVHFEDTEDEKTLYKFSTMACKTCEILESVNASMGAYEAVYVAGDRLVFDDYNTVTDGELKIGTNGIIPVGTLKISANGQYSVGKYAEVDVMVEDAMPKISVGASGVVNATTPAGTTRHQLSASDDPDFIAENIKCGVGVFGVEGKCPSVSYAIGKIENQATSGYITIYYMGIDPDAYVASNAVKENPYFCNRSIYKGDKNTTYAVVQNSPVVINSNGAKLTVTGHADIVANSGSLFVIKPTANNFDIIVTN